MSKAMRVLMVTGLVLLMSTAAFAKGSGDAYNAGHIFLSGSTNLDLAFGTDTMEPDGGSSVDTDHTEIGLGTRVGYFVIKGWEIGLGLNYDSDKATVDVAGTETVTTSSEMLIGLQTAYFFNLSGAIDPYGALLIGYSSRSTEVEPDGGTSTTDEASGFPAYEIEAGVNIQVASGRVGIAPALFYRGYSRAGTTDAGGTDADYDESGSRFGFKVAVNGFLAP